MRIQLACVLALTVLGQTGCLQKPSGEGAGSTDADSWKADADSWKGDQDGTDVAGEAIMPPADLSGDPGIPSDLLELAVEAAAPTDAPQPAELPDGTAVPDAPLVPDVPTVDAPDVMELPEIIDQVQPPDGMDLADQPAPDAVLDTAQEEAGADTQAGPDESSQDSEVPADVSEDVSDAAPCVPDCSGKQCGTDGCGGTCGTCDDGVPCTDDQCTEQGQCAFPFNQAPCDDGNECTADDVCVEGLCTGTWLPPEALVALECVCYSDDDCKPLQDENPCNGALFCQPVAPPGLLGFCAVLPESVPVCGDLLYCNGIEVCVENQGCAPGALDWSDGIDCTQDLCDEENDVLVHSPDDSLCDDSNPCTNDMCHTLTGCQNLPNTFLCDDADPCTQHDVCAGGTCIGSDPLACDDGKACTVDSCVPGQGCAFVPEDSKCDDANPCTTDVCDPLEGCVHEPIAGECSDLDPCTVGDSCQDGVCVPGGSALDCLDAHSCTEDYCVKGIGCVHLPKDGPCDDSNPCTDDTCDSDLGCQYAPNAASCDDLDACTAGDLCSGGICSGPAPASCDDAVACTVDTCKSPTGCVHTPDHEQCTDSVPCTVNTCDKVKGCTFPPSDLLCNDNIPCTVDTCDAAAGCKFTPNNGLCNDSNGCTVDSCNAATGCVFTPTVDYQNDPNNCGWCGNKCTPVTQMCSGGKCVCAPQCAGKQCGDNSCGGSCGACNSPAVCFNTTCCTPKCTGKVCGDNGCGGVCGTCGGTTTCINGGCYQTGCSNGKCLVTPGGFMMGCNAAVDTQCYASEYPYHEVILGGYYIDELEVKASDFANFLKTNNNNCGNPCITDGQAGANVVKLSGVWQAASGKGNYPANMVTWAGAWHYCLWVGKRMCTEAEWEKAARGTDGRKYPWGNSPLDCNHAALGNIGAAGCPTNMLPVGSKPSGKSPYGAQDMLGNIVEWVEDDFICNFYCKGNGGSNNTDHNCSCSGQNPYQNPWYDPLGFIMGQNQVGRGGHTTTTNTANLRVSARYPLDGMVGDYNRGVRCCDDL